ncbi:MAG: flavin reductase family protein [Jannaschia sp.]
MAASAKSKAMDDLRTRYLHAMSMAAATVNVVTTDGPAGRAGVTVSAMTSVSVDGDAPTMLVCLNDTASATGPILENKCFAINVMDCKQQDVADTFANRQPAPGGDKFADLHWDVMTTGAPALQSLATFDCTVQSSQRIGTHHVIIGAVHDVRVSDGGSPLIWGMRKYLRAEPA